MMDVTHSDCSGLLSVVVTGHVDHGKSTLLGRILLDCGKIAEERIERVQEICQAKGMSFEPAFLLDALREEREQGISIDTTRMELQFAGRRFVLIDAPGHLEFLKNMVTGASEAQTAILVVDCSQGIRSQTERHARALSILGLSNVIAVVNKLDQVRYDQSLFETVSQDIRRVLDSSALRCLAVIPVSAIEGDNIATNSVKMPWFMGTPLLPFLSDLANRHAVMQDPSTAPLRMPLQGVYKLEDKRYFVGQIQSGSIAPGDTISFSPSGKTSRVEAVERYGCGQLPRAYAGDSIALLLSEQVFVERGEIISRPDELPEIDIEFRANLMWLSPTPLDPSCRYLIKIGTAECHGQLNVQMQLSAGAGVDTGTIISNGSAAEVIVKLEQPLAFDLQNGNVSVNNFVVCSDNETLAAGTICGLTAGVADVSTNPNVRREEGYITRELHELANGHRGAVLWVTGISGAGKSTLAKVLERRLFAENYRVVVLDGDNLRLGLCAGIGFSREQRTENVRRIAHAARLFLNAGFIVVVACISPYAADRELARKIIGNADFHEVFLFCPIETCRARDAKGLYHQASMGTISGVSGLDAPYQPPRSPDLRLDSSTTGVEEEADVICQYLKSKSIIQDAHKRKSAFQASDVLAAASMSTASASPVTAGDSSQ